MNREHTLEAIAIMQAWADGLPVEGKQWGAQIWQEIDTRTFCGWNFHGYEYRLKPVPRVGYLLVDHTGGTGDRFYDESDARSAIRARNHWVGMKKFVEVIV